MSSTGNPYADTGDMYLVHTAFRREFGLLPALVRGVSAGQTERARIVADHIQLLTRCLHEHHSGEDAGYRPVPGRRGRQPDLTVAPVPDDDAAPDAVDDGDDTGHDPCVTSPPSPCGADWMSSRVTPSWSPLTVK